MYVVKCSPVADVKVNIRHFAVRRQYYESIGKEKVFCQLSVLLLVQKSAEFNVDQKLLDQFKLAVDRYQNFKIVFAVCPIFNCLKISL